MDVELNCVGSFILGFLCAILFIFLYAALTVSGDDDD